MFLFSSCATTKIDKQIKYDGKYLYLVKRDKRAKHYNGYLHGDICLELYKDSTFRYYKHDRPNHFNKYECPNTFGKGHWHEHQDFILLSFIYIESNFKETERLISGDTYLERMNMYLEKKRENKLVLNRKELKCAKKR